MPGGPHGVAAQNFLKQVERTTNAFVGSDDTGVEDVRRTLIQLRQQYDAVHHEADQKDAKLRSVKEEIRTADLLHGQKADETHRLDETFQLLAQRYNETMKQISETRERARVYDHMLARMQKEQAILKEKMLTMDLHWKRKLREVNQKAGETERVRAGRVQNSMRLDVLSQDTEAEREACRSAREIMQGELERRRDANKRRADFESWRHEVALEAANEAFNASAGRLRKLYAIEKLAGNSLQKNSFEQVERSQNTEDGFQKIRDVTGLADVMDIVHKFLNWEVEHEQLKKSVTDAELRLEALQKVYAAFKLETEGMTFGEEGADKSGSIYKDIEHTEQQLTEAMEEHEACRMRLQKTTLQMEHMKRWADRIGKMLASFEEPKRIEGPADLADFFRRLEVAVERFVGLVGQQVTEGKITQKALFQVMTREYNEQSRILSNTDFLRVNCRVPAAADAVGRPTSRQGNGEDNPANSFEEERERCKKDSQEKVLEAAQQKKRPKGS